jgi:predicted nucleotidyltransferase
VGQSDKGWDIAASRAYLKRRQEQQEGQREERRQAALAALRQAAQSVLPRYPAVKRAYLFGSVMQPAGLRATSDVDVAVEGDLGAEEYFAVWRDLERAAPGWAIDLVELGQDVRFSEGVRTGGELVYERQDPDPKSRD